VATRGGYGGGWGGGATPRSWRVRKNVSPERPYRQGVLCSQWGAHLPFQNVRPNSSWQTPRYTLTARYSLVCVWRGLEFGNISRWETVGARHKAFTSNSASPHHPLHPACPTQTTIITATDFSDRPAIVASHQSQSSAMTSNRRESLESQSAAVTRHHRESSQESLESTGCGDSPSLRVITRVIGVNRLR
jgi:hypothetical protein